MQKNSTPFMRRSRKSCAMNTVWHSRRPPATASFIPSRCALKPRKDPPQTLLVSLTAWIIARPISHPRLGSGQLPVCRPSWSYRVTKSYYLLTKAFFDNQKQRGASETYCHFDSRHRLEGLPTAGGWCGLDRSHVTAVARSC